MCVVVCCSVLSCVVVCCRVLQRVSLCCSMFRCVAAHQRQGFSRRLAPRRYLVLQCVTVYCSVLHHIRGGVFLADSPPFSTLLLYSPLFLPTHPSTIFNAVVYCSVLQCVATCCSTSRTRPSSPTRPSMKFNVLVCCSVCCSVRVRKTDTLIAFYLFVWYFVTCLKTYHFADCF